MPKTYTLTEASEALEADSKTLRRWIDIEGWNLDAQTTVYDKRIKYLTEDQVKKLAGLHERSWPPKPRPTEQTGQGTPGAVKLLAERVEALEHHVNQMGSQAAEYSRLLADVTLRNDRLERQAAEQSALITALAEQMTELQRPARKPRAAAAKADEPLPDDLVDWRTFTNRHSVRQNDVRQAIDNGSLKVMKGRWMNDSSITKEALDAEGRARFWVLFSSQQNFRKCDDCPHSAGGEAHS